MNQFDPILFRELPIVRKIIQDETWLEGERRGCYVPSSDSVVRERVCAVVLRIGKQLRESISASLAASAPAADAPTLLGEAPREMPVPPVSKATEAA